MMGEEKKERGVDVGIMSSECVPFQEEHEEGGHLFGRTGGGRWHLRQTSVLGGIGIGRGEKCCRGVGAGARVRRDGEAYNHLPCIYSG